MHSVLRRDRRIQWRWIAFHFVPWLAVLNLAWETAHLPLYTLWKEASPGYLIFVVVHCTAGDVLIGASALLLGLMLVPDRRRNLIVACMVIVVIAYTAFSEWLNSAVLLNWTYSEWMPAVRIQSFSLGLSPMLQALVVPALAAHLAGFSTSKNRNPWNGVECASHDR